MVRWFALVLAMLAFAMPASAQTKLSDRQLHGIKGADQRLAMEPAAFPWSAMGRVNFGIGHCSGTLIGPKLVATAAHCLWNRRTQRPMPASAYTFVAGFDRGEYLKASKVVALHPAPGWQFGDDRQASNSRADDWALMELEDPVGDEIGWIALAEPKTGMTIGVAGYGRDRAFVPLAHLGCRLLEQPRPGVFYHDCDAVQGESGGPVFAWVGDQIRLVAINVAVIPSKGEMGVAASVGGLKSTAMALGAASSTRAGPLSRPSGLDLGASLGR
ncbi:protease ydgD precursor [Paramagnetospirillum marisnigri]|uniref:Protease ydgD n=1 Tax=Paramagnetospirillum marisnigri TaxID=1285242 RepID=A0A178MT17_9PROT|nr:trypsin-like serine protease [Paramagnetospirillum marisnigri]OAN52901.1 protease ydgD precursor [Paramagnetospirillum marisnigri]